MEHLLLYTILFIKGQHAKCGRAFKSAKRQQGHTGWVLLFLLPPLSILCSSPASLACPESAAGLNWPSTPISSFTPRLLPGSAHRCSTTFLTGSKSPAEFLNAFYFQGDAVGEIGGGGGGAGDDQLPYCQNDSIRPVGKSASDHLTEC